MIFDEWIDILKGEHQNISDQIDAGIRYLRQLDRPITGRPMLTQFLKEFLMIFSHLSPQILGQEVNAWTNTSASQRPFVSCSSFGVSAVVIPRNALWDYFCARAAYEVVSQVFEKDDDNIVEQQFNILSGQLIEKLKKCYKDDIDLQSSREVKEYIDQLNRYQENIKNGDSLWEDFQKRIDGVAYNTIQQAGLSGLQKLLYKVQDEQYRKDFARKMPMRPYKTFHQENRLEKMLQHLWTIIFLRPDDAQREKMMEDIDDKSEQFWNELLGKIQSYAKKFVERIDRLSGDRERIISVLGDELRNSARQIKPFGRSSDPDTSTFYDLETGALSLSQLDKIWQHMSQVLDRTEEDATPRQILYQNIYELIRDQDNVSVDNLFSKVKETLGQIPWLRKRLEEHVHFKAIVSDQRDQGVRSPNDRIDQVISKANHHAPLDDDTFSHSAADEHPISVAAVPSAASEENKSWRRELQEYGIQAITVYDYSRIDVIKIVHGLRLDYLSSLPELYRQYKGSDFDPRLLHLEPGWATDLIELYEDPGSAKRSPNNVTGTTSGSPVSSINGQTSTENQPVSSHSSSHSSSSTTVSNIGNTGQSPSTGSSDQRSDGSSNESSQTSSSSRI